MCLVLSICIVLYLEKHSYHMFIGLATVMHICVQYVAFSILVMRTDCHCWGGGVYMYCVNLSMVIGKD